MYFCQPQVDTSIPGSPSGAEVWLSVAVLMSYEHMGTSVVVRPLCCAPWTLAYMQERATSEGMPSA